MSLQEGGEDGKRPQKAKTDSKPGKTASVSRKDIVAAISAARTYFERADVKVAMREAAKKAKEWLDENDSCYEGRALDPDPWWPALPATDDALLLDSRKVLLRSKCFENGLRAFCAALAKLGVNYTIDYDCLAFAAEHQAIVVHHQLFAFHRVNRPGFDLADLAERFDYKNPTNLRNARLSQMVKLGLWAANAGRREYEGFEILLGPAAIIFHTDTLFPVYASFETNHLGRKIK